MKDAKLLTDDELLKECTMTYTKEAIKESIRKSEKQIKEGNFKVFNKHFIEELRKRHCYE